MKKIRPSFSNCLIILAILVTAGCSPYYHTLDNQGEKDYARIFAGTIENDYPFTVHKGLKWEVISSDIAGMANTEPFSDSVYMEMRERVYKIPDTRVNLSSGKDKRLKKDLTSGYLGFDLAKGVMV